MLVQHLSFDSTGQELFNYSDPSFPLALWECDFNSFSDKTILCHWHNEIEYGILLSGELDYYIDGKNIRVKKGNAILINANTMHMATQVSEEQAVIYTVSFLPSLLSGNHGATVYEKYFLPFFKSNMKGILIENAFLYGEKIIQTLNEIYELSKNKVGNYELRCLSLVCYLWDLTLKYVNEHNDEAILFCEKNNNEDTARRILIHIHEHFNETMNIEDILKAVFVSRSECFRRFRQYTNKTPVEYLNEYRLSYARKLLLETDKSITQIALECGYSNSSYFGKVFKRKYGVSPMQLKNKFI